MRRAMSLIGTKPTSQRNRLMSAFGGKAHDADRATIPL